MEYPERFRQKAKTAERGWTLTELVIVTGVMGIALAVIWLAAGAVWNNYKVYRANQQIITVMRNIKDAYGVTNKPLAAADVTTTLNDEGLLPVDMHNPSANSFGHALGGAFYARRLASGNIRLGLSNVSRQNCMAIVTEFPALMPEHGVRFIGTSVNGLTIDPANMLAATPVTSAQARAWCSSDANNEVRIEFSIRN